MPITVSPLPINTNNMVEVQALLAGLILAKQGNFRLLDIKADSSIIINACIHRTLDVKIYSYSNLEAPR